MASSLRISRLISRSFSSTSFFSRGRDACVLWDGGLIIFLCYKTIIKWFVSLFCWFPFFFLEPIFFWVWFRWWLLEIKGWPIGKRVGSRNFFVYGLVHSMLGSCQPLHVWLSYVFLVVLIDSLVFHLLFCVSCWVWPCESYVYVN